tara:strand:- start:75 stop:557 length:483 start_codon:yes stop_codon:yes gene_type:complete
MQPEIVSIDPKLLVGLKIEMSFSKNKTATLWQTFMPKKHLVSAKSDELFSVEVYPDLNFFKTFDPTKTFEKWAAVEVNSAENLAEDFEVLKISEGLFAKFTYQGKASEAATFYNKIFGEWLPNSEYRLSNRPHFAVMDEKYKGEEAISEEEIFIPIEKKV